MRKIIEAIFRHSYMCSTVLHTILRRLDDDMQHFDCHLRYNSGFLIETIMESLRLLLVFGVRLFAKQIISDFAVAGQEILSSPKSSRPALEPTQPPIQ
jgi:hypothetical protein